MTLRNFLLFSSLICALFFFLGTSWALTNPWGQRLFQSLKDAWEISSGASLDWPLGFKSLGLSLGLGNIALYFLGKNWSKGLYLGIFALIMLASVLIAAALISN